MSNSRASGLGMTLLVGGILLLVIAGLILVLVPVAECPNCRGTGRADIQVDNWWVTLHPELKQPKTALRFTVHCARCDGQRKAAPFGAWTKRYETSAR